MIYNPLSVPCSFKISLILLILLLTSCQTNRRSDPSNVFRSYSRAIEQYEAKNYQDALNYINEAIKANNKIAQHFELKGDILMDSGEPIRALKEYKTAKDLRFSTGILIKIGKTQYQLKDIEAAVKNFRTAYAQKPGKTEILLLLVNCFVQQKEYVLALNQLQEYKKQCEKFNIVLNSEYYILLGKIYYEKELYNECIVAVEQAAGKRSRNQCFFYLMALFKEKMYDKAYNLVTKDFNNVLLESDVYFFRGFYYYSVNNYNVAKTLLELSVDSNTKIMEAFNILSVLYEKEGDIEQAKQLKESANSLQNIRVINIGS